jgi:hypothetical protein
MNIFLIAALLSLAPIGLALLFLFRTLSLRQQGELSFDRCLALPPERYRVMERLLHEGDFRFLATQPGFSPQMGRRFRAQRRRIFRSYLRNLRMDFGRMSVAVQALILHAAEDRGDLAAALMRQRLMFMLGMLAIEARLLLHAVGVGAVDVGDMVGSFETMQVQIRLLMIPAQSAQALG